MARFWLDLLPGPCRESSSRDAAPTSLPEASPQVEMNLRSSDSAASSRGEPPKTASRLKIICSGICLLCLLGSVAASQLLGEEKRKVIIDEDSAGPGGTAMQAI